MPKTLKFLSIISFSLLFGLWSNALQAQEPDSTQTKKTLADSLAPSKKRNIDIPPFAGFRLGLDIVPSAINIFDQDILSLEASTEILLGNKYAIAGDIGYTTIDRGRKAGQYQYQVTGSYIRVGADYNMWHQDRFLVGGIFTIGLRYGLAIFNQKFNYQLNSPYFLNQQSGESNQNNLSGHWIEIVSNMRARITKNVLMGPVVRLKFKVAGSQTNLVKINDIPGYGFNQGFQFGIGYYLMYQFSLNQKK
jgi:hypothetical protein